MFVVACNFLLVLAVLLTIVYKTKQRFRFYMRYTLYIAIVSLFSILFLPIYILRPGNVHNTVLGSYIVGPLLNFLLGLKWHLRNPENFVSNSGSIICANHQSLLDFIGMLTYWPLMKRCAAIARKEVSYVLPFGITARLCGTIFIPRNRPIETYSALNRAAERVKQNKLKLWIFPEGTRGSGEEILPFKKGAFHLAITSQLPITPIVYSRYYFLKYKEERFDPGEVIMTVLPPFSTVGMTLDQIPELMENVRDQMVEVYKKTSAEVYSRSRI